LRIHYIIFLSLTRNSNGNNLMIGILVQNRNWWIWINMLVLSRKIIFIKQKKHLAAPLGHSLNQYCWLIQVKTDQDKNSLMIPFLNLVLQKFLQLVHILIRLFQRIKVLNYLQKSKLIFLLFLKIMITDKSLFRNVNKNVEYRLGIFLMILILMIVYKKLAWQLEEFRKFWKS